MWIITGEGEMFISEAAQYSNSESLTFHLKEEIKDLRAKNELLNREIGRLEGQIMEIKKSNVHTEENADFADASGS